MITVIKYLGSVNTHLKSIRLDLMPRLIDVISDNLANNNLENLIITTFNSLSYDEMNKFIKAASLSQEFFNKLRKHCVYYTQNQYDITPGIVEVIVSTLFLKGKEVKFSSFLGEGGFNVVFELFIDNSKTYVLRINKSNNEDYIHMDDVYNKMKIIFSLPKLYKFFPDVLISSNDLEHIQENGTNYYFWTIVKKCEPINENELVKNKKIFNKWVEFMIDVIDEEHKNGFYYLDRSMSNMMFDGSSNKFVLSDFDLSYIDSEFLQRGFLNLNLYKATNRKENRALAEELTIKYIIYEFCTRNNYIDISDNMKNDMNGLELIEFVMQKLKIICKSEKIKEFIDRDTTKQFSNILNIKVNYSKIQNLATF